MQCRRSRRLQRGADGCRGHRRCWNLRPHRRNAYGIPYQKARSGGTCHEDAPNRLRRLSHPAVLLRHGPHARLATARSVCRPRALHDARPHRAHASAPHPLYEPRLLYQRLQIPCAPRPHHGRAYRHRRHGERGLVGLRALCHGRPTRPRPGAHGHDDRHGQPVLRKRGHHPHACHRRQVPGVPKQVKDGQRHRGAYRPRPQTGSSCESGRQRERRRRHAHPGGPDFARQAR